jgi:hypothetical protein
MKQKHTPDRELVYILFHREHLGDSKINAGAEVWRLHWYCADDGTHWITDVDTSMNNWRRSNWAEIVHSRSPWGMYRNLRRVTTRTTRIFDEPVLSADSRWVMIERNSAADVAEAIAALEAHHFPHRNTAYQELFA